MAQVLTIVAVRPASLTAFFKKQHASQGAAPAKACEVPRLLANALPLVLHSLQAHTGNPTFPPSFLEWLVLSCVAAAVKCAEAMTGTFDHAHDVCTYVRSAGGCYHFPHVLHLLLAMANVAICYHLHRPRNNSYRSTLHCEHICVVASK